jgi:hypothetical protein
MPISVPALSANIDTSIYNKEAPKSMSLSDMVNIARGSLALKKEQQTFQSDVARAQAESQTAQTQANSAQLENKIKHANIAVQNIQQLLNKPDLKEADIVDMVKRTAENNGGDEASVRQALMGLSNAKTTNDYKAWLAQKLAASTTALSQLEKIYPATQQVDVGGQIVNMTTGNPALAAEAPGVPTGPYMQKSLAPTVATSPTGGPMAFGGGGVPQAGNLDNRPTNVQVAPAAGGANVTNMPSNAPKTSGVSNQSMREPKNAGAGPSAIPYVPGEPYDAFRVRAGDVAKMPKAASEALNINNIDSIPNQKFTNEKIQKLLDKPSLDIGAISKAIADKTGGIGLDDDQQEIIKYLEQRIRYESARSNQDQASQRSAFGSFGTNRGALREILYKDNGSLAGQELYQRGILNHAGDINKPNLQSVNQFNNDYAKLAEPRVVHLMGVIGDKSVKDLTKADKQHLAKEFAGLSSAQIQQLMDKRQKLIDLVGK